MEFIREIVELIYMLRHWAWQIYFLIFIIIFKKPIFEFLKRLKTLKIFSIGVEAVIPSDQKVEEIKKPLPKYEELIERKDIEKKELAKLLLEVLKDHKELFERYKLERIFNIIYGTQIDLLEHLLIKGTSGERYIGLGYFYDKFVKRSGSSSYKKKDYIGFLKDIEYIEYVGEGYYKMIVKITEYGRKFLSYIKDQHPRRYRDKPF